MRLNSIVDCRLVKPKEIKSNIRFGYSGEFITNNKTDQNLKTATKDVKHEQNSPFYTEPAVIATSGFVSLMVFIVFMAKRAFKSKTQTKNEDLHISKIRNETEQNIKTIEDSIRKVYKEDKIARDLLDQYYFDLPNREELIWHFEESLDKKTVKSKKNGYDAAVKKGYYKAMHKIVDNAYNTGNIFNFSLPDSAESYKNKKTASAEKLLFKAKEELEELTTEATTIYINKLIGQALAQKRYDPIKEESKKAVEQLNNLDKQSAEISSNETLKANHRDLTEEIKILKCKSETALFRLQTMTTLVETSKAIVYNCMQTLHANENRIEQALAQKGFNNDAERLMAVQNICEKIKQDNNHIRETLQKFDAEQKKTVLSEYKFSPPKQALKSNNNN